MDSLATKIIEVLKSTEMQASWINDKKIELLSLDRLEVLRWMSKLDDSNLAVVCASLGIDVQDMNATQRVLKKI